MDIKTPTSRSIIGEMNFDGVLKYNPPFIVSFSGLPGSGKTDMSRQLSRDLRIFLLSNDYVRKYYYYILREYAIKNRAAIETITKTINLERLLILLANHIPFVYDRDCNDIRYYNELERIIKIFKYELIKIQINSSDEDNIARIGQRRFDLDDFDDTIIGDGYAYSEPADRNQYNIIRARKPRSTLKDVSFDYTIDNYGSKEDFDEQVKMVSSDISRRMK